ncbi:hypothetical protein KBD59_02215 [Candidatus Gracilibacteria bacterium]|nr:hypothetical protein [Candidatus Gracilibacteria bacterium]
MVWRESDELKQAESERDPDNGNPDHARLHNNFIADTADVFDGRNFIVDITGVSFEDLYACILQAIAPLQTLLGSGYPLDFLQEQIDQFVLREGASAEVDLHHQQRTLRLKEASAILSAQLMRMGISVPVRIGTRSSLEETRNYTADAAEEAVRSPHVLRPRRHHDIEIPCESIAKLLAKHVDDITSSVALEAFGRAVTQLCNQIAPKITALTTHVPVDVRIRLSGVTQERELIALKYLLRLLDARLKSLKTPQRTITISIL